MSKLVFKRLGDIATFINGYAFKPNDWVAAGLPIIRIQNLNDEKAPFHYYNSVIDDKYLVTKGDILISWSGSIGVYEWQGNNAILNQHIFKVIFNKSKINKKYFKFIVRNSINRALQYLHGSTMKHFTKKNFDEILVPIPELDIQKKIANALEQIEFLIDKRKAQIAALSSLTQSVFYEMFGDPITNNNNFEYEKLVNISIKITDGTHHSPPAVTEGIPYISAKHLKDGILDFYRAPVYVSEEDHQQIYSRCNPQKGDVIYIKDGVTTGMAAINNYNFQFSMLSSLALIKCNEEVLNNTYLVHYLNNHLVKKRIINNMSGGAIKRLTIKKIKDIHVMLPPLEQQIKFSKIIKVLEDNRKRFRKSLKQLENNFNSLMQQAFKGQLFNKQ